MGDDESGPSTVRLVFQTVLGMVTACFDPAAFRRVLWLLALGLVGMALTIILVLVIRVPVDALPTFGSG